MGVGWRMPVPLWVLALALACAQHTGLAQLGTADLGHPDLPLAPPKPGGDPVRRATLLPPLRTVPVVLALNPAHHGRVCSAWGDFHYKTFDGDVFRFPGRCNYVFSAHCGAAYEDFNVQLRRGLDGIASLSGVTLKLDGMVVQLTKASVLVNGSPVQLPFSRSGVAIKRSSSRLKVVARLGLVFMWNQDDSLQLELDAKYANQTCGLCGDFDGAPGLGGLLSHNISVNPLEFGNLQKMDGPTEQCSDPAPEPPMNCSSGSGVCEDLLGSRPFKGCHGLVDASSYVEACRHDLCTCEQAKLNSCVCDTLAEYARQCAHAGGQPLDWRGPDLCPQTCPPGMQHQECGSPCTDTCSNPERSRLCEDHCEDGCFCPEGTVLDDIGQAGCIPMSQCSCVHNGATYAPGTGYSTDCTNCTCFAGRWSCQEGPCPGTCAVVGGAHFSTFDQRQYTVHGACSYVLAKSCESSAFSVLAELRRCGLTDSETCLKAVTLSLQGGDTVVEIKASGEVFVNHIYSQLPVSTANVTLFRPSTFFIIAHTDLGLQLDVQLVPTMQAFVRLAPKLRGRTCGLCGNFNQNQADDFRTLSGVVEGTAAAFANSWKTQATCPDVQNSFEDPCALSVENEKYAQRWCSRLTDPQGPFARCHAALSPSTHYSNCMFDTCNCEKSEDCMCAALSSYVRACAALGVLLDGWRDDVCNTPTTTCPKSLSYQYHVSTCQPTCRGRAHEDAACGVSFVPVDGCTCPQGTFLDDSGSCVPPEACPCYYRGSVVPNGETLYQTGAICTCTRGTLTCIGGQAPTPACAAPMVYLDCRNATPGASCRRTCHTLDVDCYSLECEPGCVCPEGLVADGAGGCVAPAECPCMHNEASYRPGQAVRVGCNTCTCQGGRWQCTDEPCLATCAVYGDGHYLTFDGQRYSFSGDCEYTLLQDHCGGNSSAQDTFRVVTENVPCGTTGVTCSKAIKIFLGSYQLRLSDGKVEVMERAAGQAAPYTIRQMGIYLVVDTQAGLVLLWDKKTSIFLRLSPEFKGRVCGLCGNFDDNAANDFTTRSLSVVGDALEFGNSWKFSPSCPDAPAPRDACSVHPNRRSWAQKQCSVIHSPAFAACRAHVEPAGYYEACVSDACACDLGGDCECFCTAVAAYAQACHDVGVCVAWRTPDICPLFCDYYNPEDQCVWHYQPCGVPCMRTCRNPSGHCLHDVRGLEGCYPKCPPEAPILDEDQMKCVATCPTPPPPPPCLVQGKPYKPGAAVPSTENCQSCNCTEGGVRCVYDAHACVCIYDGRRIPFGVVIYNTTDGTGGCIIARCGDNGTIHREVFPCGSTPVPPTIFSFSTPPLTVSSMPPPGTPPESTLSPSPATTEPSTPSHCGEDCQWSHWLDVSRPGRGADSGDFDTLDNLRAHGYRLCQAPRAVQCRAEDAPEVPLQVLGQHVVCSPATGLVCSNRDQASGLCHNYQIRVQCCTPRPCSTPPGPSRTSASSPSSPAPSSTTLSTTSTFTTATVSTDTPTPTSCLQKRCSWTKWIDGSYPQPDRNGGDFDTFHNLRAKGYKFCQRPTAVECRAESFPDTPLALLEQNLLCNTQVGLLCLNKDQLPPICYNYEIRIQCCEWVNVCGTSTTAPAPSTHATSHQTPASSKHVPPETHSTASTTFTPASTTSAPTTRTTSSPTTSTSSPTTSTTSSPTTTTTSPRTSTTSPMTSTSSPTTSTTSSPMTSTSSPTTSTTSSPTTTTTSPTTTTSSPMTSTSSPTTSTTSSPTTSTSSPTTSTTSSPTTTTTSPTTTTSSPMTSTTSPTTTTTSPTTTTSSPTTSTTSPMTSTSSPTTSTTSSPTTSTTSSSTTSTTSAPSSETYPHTHSTTDCQLQCTWTKWFDVDFPAPGPHGGDFETYNNIVSRGEKMCRKEYVTRLECRAENHPEVSIDQLGQVVQCRPDVGLVCWNQDQEGPFKICLNYEVRVLCCEPQEGCPVPTHIVRASSTAGVSITSQTETTTSTTSSPTTTTTSPMTTTSSPTTSTSSPTTSTTSSPMTTTPSPMTTTSSPTTTTTSPTTTTSSPTTTTSSPTTSTTSPTTTTTSPTTTTSSPTTTTTSPTTTTTSPTTSTTSSPMTTTTSPTTTTTSPTTTTSSPTTSTSSPTTSTTSSPMTTTSSPTTTTTSPTTSTTSSPTTTTTSPTTSTTSSPMTTTTSPTTTTTSPTTTTSSPTTSTSSPTTSTTSSPMTTTSSPTTTTTSPMTSTTSSPTTTTTSPTTSTTSSPMTTTTSPTTTTTSPTSSTTSSPMTTTTSPTTTTTSPTTSTTSSPTTTTTSPTTTTTSPTTSTTSSPTTTTTSPMTTTSSPTTSTTSSPMTTTTSPTTTTTSPTTTTPSPMTTTSSPTTSTTSSPMTTTSSPTTTTTSPMTSTTSSPTTTTTSPTTTTTSPTTSTTSSPMTTTTSPTTTTPSPMTTTSSPTTSTTSSPMTTTSSPTTTTTSPTTTTTSPTTSTTSSPTTTTTSPTTTTSSPTTSASSSPTTTTTSPTTTTSSPTTSTTSSPMTTTPSPMTTTSSTTTTTSPTTSTTSPTTTTTSPTTTTSSPTTSTTSSPMSTTSSPTTTTTSPTTSTSSPMTSTSSPTTSTTSSPTTSTTSSSTTSTTSAPSSETYPHTHSTTDCQLQCTWTKWFDVDFPAPGPHGGDFETYNNIVSRGEKMCRKEYVTRLECRAENHPEVSIDQLGQVVQCRPDVGLVCWNQDQEGPFKICLNYEVRVLCCEPQEGCPVPTHIVRASSTAGVSITSQTETTTSTTSSPTTTTTSPMTTTSSPTTSTSSPTTSTTSSPMTTTSSPTTSTSSPTTSTTSTPMTSTSSPTTKTSSPTTSTASTPTTSTLTPASIMTCYCSVNRKLYPAGSVIYQESDLAGHCYYAVCTLDCHVFRGTDCHTSTPTPPASSPPASSPLTSTSVTKPGCKNTVPPRRTGQTWPMPNCSVATCEGNNVISISRRPCPPLKELTCANGYPAVLVADADGCCHQYQCQCVCSGWGDPHYITFDGTYYTFLDNCTYVLVQQIVPVFGHFRVLIDNYFCDAEDGLSCPQSITVEYRQARVVLIRKLVHGLMTNEILFDNKVVSAGFQKDGIIISQIGIKMYVTIPELGVQVMFSGLIFSVEVPFSKFANNTEGQCGTCTDDLRDECRLPGGTVLSSCSAMAGHWKVVDSKQPFCLGPPPTPTPLVTPTPCLPSPICELILSDVFQKCHSVIPPWPYYEGCVFDQCYMALADVVCSGLQLYAALCASNGVCVDWRRWTNHTCGFPCPAGKVYQPCGPSSPTYCYGTASTSYVILEEVGTITEGCFCPQGTMPFSAQADICVPTNCTECLGHHGEPVKPGQTVTADCQECTCHGPTRTLQCRRQPCPLPPFCLAPGFVPVPTPLLPGQCCPDYNCACNTSYCPQPSKCPLGYRQELTYEDGACCPTESCRPSGCNINGTVYQPGAVVSQSQCETCRCEDTFTVHCEPLKCNTSCPVGSEYQVPRGQCCGVCVPVACVINGSDGSVHIFTPGQNWSDPGNRCEVHECERHLGRPVVVTRKTVCPPLQCSPDEALLSEDGCCLSCPPRTYNMSRCAVYRERQVIHSNNCSSAGPVLLSRCQGYCEDSFSKYSLEAQALQRHCSCCQEVRVSRRNVTLHCPDGSRQAFSYVQVEECDCTSLRCGPHGELEARPKLSTGEPPSWSRRSRAQGPGPHP